MTAEVDEKFVVVSKASADDTEYVRAVVHPNEESAADYLAEVKAATPWQSHTVVAAADFEKAAPEKDTETTEGEF